MTPEELKEFEEKFEMKNFALYCKEKDIPATTNYVIDFINNLLKSRQEKMIEAMEKSKVELWKPMEFPKGKEGILDSETCQIAIENAKNMRDNHYEIGFNDGLDKGIEVINTCKEINKII